MEDYVLVSRDCKKLMSSESLLRSRLGRGGDLTVGDVMGSEELQCPDKARQPVLLLCSPFQVTP